jgi:hypothetical protein
LTITAANGAGTHFKFMKFGSFWRVSDDAGEIHRIKTNSVDLSMLASGSTYVDFAGMLTLKNSKGELSDINASLIVKCFKVRSTGHNFGVYQVVETTNNGILLSCPIWVTLMGNSAGNFSFVKNGSEGGYYLSFTYGGSRLYLSAISSELTDGGYVVDPTVGGLSHPKDDSFVRGGVDHIIDLRQFENWQRFFKGGGGVASASEVNNVLTLTVTNAAGSKFTFSNQDGQWHAYSFWGEISRVKGNQ